jgi:sugar/nucleoside kinase (ribokinase family)
MAGAAALDLSAAFVGQVADDQLGAIFAHDMRSLGVRFETPALAGPPPTGRCLILVTDDAQRTMNTCPGASHGAHGRGARQGHDSLGEHHLPRRLSLGA